MLHAHLELLKSMTITLILGPMYSGKSTELIKRVRRHFISKQQCLLIKYNADIRYSNKVTVCTHDMYDSGIIPCVAFGKTIDLSNINIDSTTVVGIDEGQFYDNLADICLSLSDSGKTVYVSALNGTYMKKIFSTVAELIPHCDDIIYLTAVCDKCHKDAVYSHRLVNSEDIELIGGTNVYVALCRKCSILPTEE